MMPYRRKTNAGMTPCRPKTSAQHDAIQTENQRQHDAMQEVLRVFEGRVTRLEEKAGIGPENAE